MRQLFGSYAGVFVLTATFVTVALAGEENILNGLRIPSPENQGEWERLPDSPSSGGRVTERWNWNPAGDTGMSPTISVEFRRQSPVPAPSEIARAFQRAVSRTSYSGSVSDQALPDGSQWVEYSLPMEGEAGYKKIIPLEAGIITLTLATSDKFNPDEGSYESRLWDSLKKSLRDADWQDFQTKNRR